MRRTWKMAVAAALLLGLPPDDAAAQCVGRCGTSAADGVVTTPPGFDRYGWVSTAGGTLAGGLPGVGGTNGSLFRTAAFSAAAGQSLEFYFNYVTSDGSGYADYGWARILRADLSASDLLFTARTTPHQSTVPGFDMPAPGAVVTPSPVAIVPGAPVWSPLGISSGECFAAGCGFTDWVRSSYVVAEGGSYLLEFGVTNWSDAAFHSGLAFAGTEIGDDPVDDTPGSTQDLALLPDGVFDPDPTDDIPPGFQFSNALSGLWYDPPAVDAYEFVSTGGSLFTQVGLPVGFLAPFDVYYGPGFSQLFGSFAGGTVADFTALGGLSAFKIAGITPTVDAADPMAFPVQLWWDQPSGNAFTMTPIPSAVVPEPASVALVGTGLVVLLGGAWRGRRQTTA